MKSLPFVVLTLALVATSTSASKSVAEEDAPMADEMIGVPPEADGDLLDCCLDCCCPCWTVRAGVVHWWRDQTSNPPILQDAGIITGFAARQFDFMESPSIDTNLSNVGLDISLRHDDCCGCGTEFRYLRIHTDDSPVYDGLLVSPATNPLTNFSDTVWNLNYDSDVDSLELLKHHCCGKFDVSYGLRYVNLDERLILTSLDTDFVFGAENNLYGFQLGADGTLWDNCCGLRVESSAKAGVYYNDADASASSVGLLVTPGAVQGSASDDNVAFVGELGLTAVYDVHCNLSLRAGYRLLVFDGVALAANQVANTGDLGGAAPPVAPVNVDWNTLLYHGLQIGVEYRH